jgi:hypothetical protein
LTCPLTENPEITTWQDNSEIYWRSSLKPAFGLLLGAYGGETPLKHHNIQTINNESIIEVLIYLAKIE